MADATGDGVRWEIASARDTCNRYQVGTDSAHTTKKKINSTTFKDTKLYQTEHRSYITMVRTTAVPYLIDRLWRTRRASVKISQHYTCNIMNFRFSPNSGSRFLLDEDADESNHGCGRQESTPPSNAWTCSAWVPTKTKGGKAQNLHVAFPTESENYCRIAVGARYRHPPGRGPVARTGGVGPGRTYPIDLRRYLHNGSVLGWGQVPRVAITKRRQHLGQRRVEVGLCHALRSVLGEENRVHGDKEKGERHGTKTKRSKRSTDCSYLERIRFKWTLRRSALLPT